MPGAEKVEEEDGEKSQFDAAIHECRVDPGETATQMEAIAGLDFAKETIRDTLLLPREQPHL